MIEADEVRLKQVIYNLLSNAIKFTEPGNRIGIKSWVEDNEAFIEVWDEGRGINMESLEKVFDPFIQVGQAKPQGTGLGLAISRKLIRKIDNKDIPIVALTAYAMKGDMEKFKRAGFDSYISKPIVIENLKEIIEALLG